MIDSPDVREDTDEPGDAARAQPGVPPLLPAEHVLILERTLAAPRAAVWRCWTEPDLLKQWFCPKPWTVPEADFDLRPSPS